MSAAHSIAFAPNVTPGTFNDPPSPSSDSSAESLLFPASADSNAGTRRAAHAKKKPENHIPRPPNAFMLFRSDFVKKGKVPSHIESNHGSLSFVHAQSAASYDCASTSESWITGVPFGRTAVERMVKLGEGPRMDMTEVGRNLAACFLTSLGFIVSTKIRN